MRFALKASPNKQNKATPIKFIISRQLDINKTVSILPFWEYKYFHNAMHLSLLLVLQKTQSRPPVSGNAGYANALHRMF